MELFLIVLRNIALLLLGIFLLFVIIDVVFVVSFSSILSHHDHDLFVILTNKKDNIDKLVDLLNKSGVKCDKKDIETLNNFSLKTIEHQNGEEAKKAREQLTYFSETFLYLARNNEKLSQDEAFLLIESNLNELESVYRQHVVLYNADVLGYNFWISFFPTRFIYLILRFKTKDIIS